MTSEDLKVEIKGREIVIKKLDTAIRALQKTKKDCERYADKVVCDFAIRMVNLMPPADVQEVRHASWVKNQEDMYWGNYFIRRNCSICGGSTIYHEGLGTYKLTPYCPHCGAKMSEKVGEDNGN